MKNRDSLGSQRTAAAILFLWGFLYLLVQMMVVNTTGTGHISISALGWISQLCFLGLIVLLFLDQRTVWFTVFASMQTLLSAWSLIDSFSIYNFIWFAADVLMLIIVIFTTMPPFRDGKNPLKNLALLPASLHFLPYIFILFENISSSGAISYGAMHYINANIASLALWFMAQALMSYDAPENTHAYVQAKAPPQSPSAQPASYSAASTANGPGTLLIRLSIDSLNKLSGSYGFQSGKLIGQVIPPSLLEGMTISDGDSAATLQGREYVCIVSISTPSNRLLLKEQIEPRIIASEQMKACGASPLTQLVSRTSEPLVVDGIVRNGKIEGSGGWCANGFMSAWKEQSEMQSTSAQEQETPISPPPEPAQAQWAQEALRPAIPTIETAPPHKNGVMIPKKAVWAAAGTGLVLTGLVVGLLVGGHDDTRTGGEAQTMAETSNSSRPSSTPRATPEEADGTLGMAADAEGFELPEAGTGENLYFGKGSLRDMAAFRVAFVLSEDSSEIHDVTLFAKDLNLKVNQGGIKAELSDVGIREHYSAVYPASSTSTKIDLGNSKIYDLVINGDKATAQVDYVYTHRELSGGRSTNIPLGTSSINPIVGFRRRMLRMRVSSSSVC